jgi:hypothetical protein
MELEYEPRFLDEVTLRAVRVRPEGRLFHRERERVYRLADAEARGRAFDALNLAWCERLGVLAPIQGALAEQPLVARGVGRCAVGRPPRRRDAGAELLVRPTASGEEAAARCLRLLVAPEMLLEPGALRAFLRRELQHVADMLDPRFGYAPRLPAAAGGPVHERLLRDRYRVVWDATVDGRLVRRGWLPRRVRAERRREFLAAFASLGAEGELAFTRFFIDPAPSHAAIVEFITHAAGRRASGTCALCGFPTSDPEPEPDELPAAVLADIAADFPDWRPTDGCCRQCADLYRSRPLSLGGAAALPGVR